MVSLSGCYLEGGGSLLKPLTNLRSLNFTFGDVPELYPEMTTLKSLKLKHVVLESDYFDQVPTQLTTLSITNTTSCSIRVLTRFTHLKELELDTGDFHILEILNPDIKLEKLTLYMMTAKLVHALLAQVSPDLKELNLIDCNVKSSDLTKFKNLRLNTHQCLRDIDLKIWISYTF
jgi:hypothetical protein